MGTQVERSAQAQEVKHKVQTRCSKNMKELSRQQRDVAFKIRRLRRKHFLPPLTGPRAVINVPDQDSVDQSISVDLSVAMVMSRC